MEVLNWKNAKEELPKQQSNEYRSPDILIRKKYKSVSGKILYRFDVCWYIYSEKMFVSVSGDHSMSSEIDDWCELNQTVDESK